MIPELLQRTRQPLNLRTVPAPEAFTALPGTPTVIPFTMQPQKALFLCWAAVASSVSRHYAAASSWTQCLVANEVLGGECCGNETSPNCNRMASLEDALEVTNNLSVDGVTEAALTPEEIRLQIRDLRHVVGCGIRWADTKGHFVVIHGYSIDANGVMWLAIADPRYGPSEYIYNAFATRYRDSGKWLVSYATRP